MRTKELSVAADTPMMTELLGKSKEELKAFSAAMGEPAYRGAQIYHALYSERKFDMAQITNLPVALRERLSKEARITLPEVKQRFASTDGSVRYLFALPPSEEKLGPPASVEAVFMPSEGRQTICVSTQAGCAVDCHFCLTAQLGLIRNLAAGEILAQVLLPLEEAHGDTRNEKKEAGLKPWTGLAPQTNIVLMGQGEPLLNFEPVMAAVRIMLDPEGMGISPKHLTLSTSGIVPGIERLAQEKVRPKLAISLNASNDEQRDALMPINKKYPLAALMKASKEYPLRTWEHLTFEYVLLGGVNDAAEDARRFFFSSRRRHTMSLCDWSSDVCSSDLSARRRPLWCVRATSQASHFTTWPHFGQRMNVWKPRRFRSRITCPWSSSASRTAVFSGALRSEERRGGKECRCRWER